MMSPVQKWKQSYQAEHAASPPRSEETPVTREQAVAQAQLSGKARVTSPDADKLPLSERNVCVLTDEKKLKDAANGYASSYEQMTLKELTSFWALVMSCSPASFPMVLEEKHFKAIALLLSQHIEKDADKIETISLIHVLGSLMANRQLNVKALQATRTMSPCADQRLAELVFLFAKSLQPEKGKKWDADRLSFMTLFMQQIDSAFDCSIYRIVDLFLVESLESCAFFEVCMHHFSQNATLLGLRSLGHILDYVKGNEIPPAIKPELWKCAERLDLTQFDEYAIRELLTVLFYGNAPGVQESLAQPANFLDKWAAILSRDEYKNDMEYIQRWMDRSKCSEEDDA